MTAIHKQKRKFWQWFEANEEPLFDFVSGIWNASASDPELWRSAPALPVWRSLTRNLQQVHPELVFQFGPAKEGKVEFLKPPQAEPLSALKTWFAGETNSKAFIKDNDVALERIKQCPGAWVALICPALGQGKSQTLTWGTNTADPVKALGAYVVANWDEYLKGELESPYVYVSSEQRAELEKIGKLDDFLKKMGNPVLMSRFFHQAHYEELIKLDGLTGNVIRLELNEEPIVFYSCADGEDLTANRDEELTPEQRLAHFNRRCR